MTIVNHLPSVLVTSEARQKSLACDRMEFLQTFVKTHDLAQAQSYVQKLSNEELVSLYQFLRHPENHLVSNGDFPGKKHSLELLRIHVTDTLMRRVAKDHAFGDILIQGGQVPELEKQIQCAQGISAFTNPEKLPKIAVPVPSEAPSKKRILHACVEYNKVGFTGVNAVVTTLVPQQRQTGIDARMVTPFYDIMPERDIECRKAEFKGFIEHEFAGKTVVSSIYKITPTTKAGKGVPQYLIKPDPEFANLFNIGANENIYGSTPQSEEWDRLTYLNSAIASFAAGYKGLKQQKAYDGVHIHSWTLGMTSWLLKEHNKKRQELGHSPVHSVLHFHSNTFHDHGVIAADRYRKIGIPLNQNVSSANTQALTWLGIDGLIHVSKDFARMACDSSDPEVDMADISQLKAGQGRLIGITNGINTNSWSLTERSVYGKYAAKQVQGKNGKDHTDYVAAKARLKNELFKHKIIADPKKPLFVFVGRLADEKGINALPEMVKEIQKNGGQCVVMGTIMGTYYPDAVKELESMEKGAYANCLRVYKDRDFQDKKLNNVTMGHLIRGACDYSLIPSERESCGLVFPEAVTAGCLPITTSVGGLSDFVKPHGQSDAFNCFTYDRTKSGHAGAREAIRTACVYHKSLTSRQRNEVIQRIIAESKAYDWKDRVEEISNFYDRVFTPMSKEETENVQAMTEKYLIAPKKSIPEKAREVSSTLFGKIKGLAAKVQSSFRRFQANVHQKAYAFRQKITFSGTQSKPLSERLFEKVLRIKQRLYNILFRLWHFRSNSVQGEKA